MASHRWPATAQGTAPTDRAGPSPLTDGGECGVPYESLFVNPNTDHSVQWWSVDVGPVHFLQLSSGKSYCGKRPMSRRRLAVRRGRSSMHSLAPTLPADAICTPAAAAASTRSAIAVLHQPL